MIELAPVALARRELLVRVVADGLRMGLQFCNGVEDAGQRVKKAAAIWFAPRRLWVIRQDDPARAAGWIGRHFADQAKVVDLDDVERILAQACAAIEPGFFAEVLDAQLFPLASGGHAVSFAYDLPAVDAMRELGGRFHRFAAAWEIRRPVGTILQTLRERAGVDLEFIFVHERMVVLEDLIAPPKSQASARIV